MKKHPASAFSLIELSLVIIIISVLVSAVTQGARLIGSARIAGARSSSQSSPVNSTPSLSAWWDTTSEKSFEDIDSNGGSPVNIWNDINTQVIPRYDVAASAAIRPTYVEKSSFNNLPALSFNGSQCLNGSGKFTGLTYGYSFFFVLNSSASQNAVLLTKRSGANSNFQFSLINNTTGSGTGYQACDSINCYSTDSGDTILNDKNYIVSVNLLPNAVKGFRVYQNGQEVGTGKDTTGGQLADNEFNLSIGCRTDNTSGYFSGSLAEIIMFSRPLKTTERQNIEEYLSKKWAIKITQSQ